MAEYISGLLFIADSTSAVSVMRDYIGPTVKKMLAGLASLACVFFIMHGGYMYMASSGNPNSLETAKRILRNAMVGLVLVIGAATLTAMLSGAYGQNNQSNNATLPALEAIEPEEAGNGLVEVIIKAVTGFLNNIIQSVASPFLSALDFFTKETPLMASNSGVFNLWLAVVAITNVLFILIVALIGFHVMSATSFGFDEIDLKHMLPRIGLAFLLLNTSIFLIDAVIQLSNVLISAISKISGASTVWETLTSVADESGGQGAAALLVMLVFLVFSVILLIYYIGRLVTLFLGAVLSPLVIALWLIPSFKDFSVSAIKTYAITIFVLFVHVVTLQLASTLFAGMSMVGGNSTPNVLMSMVIGLATVLVLLRTQGMMMQFSYVSLGANNTRKLGSQFINGFSYLAGRTKTRPSLDSGKHVNGLVVNSSMASQPRSAVRVRHSPSGDLSTKTRSNGKLERVRPEMSSAFTSMDNSSPNSRKMGINKEKDK